MKENKLLITPCARDGGMAFAVMMFLYVFIAFLGQTLLGSLDRESLLYNAISSLFPALALLLAGVHIVVNTKCDVNQILSVKKFNPLLIVLALILFLGMFFGVAFINTAFQSLLLDLGLNASGRTLYINNVGELIVYIITLAIIPAVTEELFFRGVILNSLECVKTVYAVILSAVCFALYHASAVQFFYQLLFGVGFALLALCAKSVVPCIIVHFINNATILILQYLNVKIDFFNPIIIAVGIVMLGAFLLFSIKALKKHQKQKETDSAKNFMLPMGGLGCFVCLFIIISNLISVA